MNNFKKYLIGFVFMVLFGISVNTQDTYALSKTEIYIQSNENYKMTITCNKPMLDYATNLKGLGYSTSGVQVCTASISGKTLTIKGKSTGTCNFYVNKNSSKNNDDRVYQIIVHTYPDSSTITPDLTNNISHDSSNSYKNQPVYVYNSRGFRLTLASAYLPTSVSGDTTGKAKPLVPSSIYECADLYGNTIRNNAYHFTPTDITGMYRNFNNSQNKASGVTTTYIRGAGYWISSNGTKHWTKIRLITVRIYPLPVLNVYNSQGTVINDMEMYEGNTYKMSTSLSNLQAGDVVNNRESIIQDDSKLSVDEAEGYWNVTALGLTNNVSTKLTYKYGVEGVVSQHNGSSYSTFSKTININVVPKPTTTTTTTVKQPTTSKNGKTTQATTTKSNTTSKAKTNKKKKLKKPSFKFVKIKKGVMYLKISKKAKKYNADGFYVKVKRGKKVIIKKAKISTVRFKITNIRKNTLYTIYVKTYKGRKESSWVSRRKRIRK